MSTILELVTSGDLFRLDPELGPDEQEWRYIYVLPRLKTWLETTLPTLGSTWAIEESPAEQLDELAWTFCSGQTLTYGWQFKPLRPVGHGIWELKTADLRMFGWFPMKDVFVGTDADSKDHIKLHKLYRGYCNQAVMLRDSLNLDDPKFIAGDDPNDVVSNFDYPA